MKQVKVARRSYFLVFVAVFLLCFSFVLYSFQTIGNKKKEQQLNDLNKQYEQLIQEKNELNYLLNDADERELFEQLARSHGYAYPDEKIYYDVTPGK